MRSILAAAVLSAIFVPMLAQAEPAVVKTFEAKIYSTASTNGWVVGELQEGASLSVSEESINGFRRVRLKDGAIGYVEERSLTFKNGASSPAAAPVTAPAASPAPPPVVGAGAFLDVVYLKNGSTVRGVIIEQTPNVSLRVQTMDGSVYAYPMSEVVKIGRESIQVATPPPPGRLPGEKSPALAWFFSFLVPGIGQYYNGDVAKGVIMNVLYFGGFATYVAAITTYNNSCVYYYNYSCTPSPGMYTLAWVGLGVATGTWVWSMIDAPVSASARNAAIRAQARPAAHMFEHDLGGALVALDVAPNFQGGAMGQLTLHY